MTIHTDIIQGTPEWFALRCGRVTGTRIAKMAGGTPATLKTLCYEVAAERITGQAAPGITQTAAMQRGTEMEPVARAEFEIETMTHVQEVGFVEVDELFGVSPDGLIGDDSGVEIKCPMPHTHLGYLLAGDKAWRAYRWQVQGSIWATGRHSWYFVSYCPTFEDWPLLVQLIAPIADDQAKIDHRAAETRAMVAEIEAKYAGLIA